MGQTTLLLQRSQILFKIYCAKYQISKISCTSVRSLWGVSLRATLLTSRKKIIWILQKSHIFLYRQQITHKNKQLNIFFIALHRQMTDSFIKIFNLTSARVSDNSQFQLGCHASTFVFLFKHRPLCVCLCCTKWSIHDTHGASRLSHCSSTGSKIPRSK